MSARVNPLGSGSERRAALVSRSIDLLRSAQDAGGAWPAAPDFAPYRYSWFRDGSFIAEGASAAGLLEEADRFHGWCAAVLRREADAVDALVERLARGEQPADAEYLPARYSLDGTRHVDDWWNFQVDGYGTWLWALERHQRRCAEAGRADPVTDEVAEAVEVATRYLTATGTHSCRDWWEEHRDRTHVTTLAGVAAGCRAALRLDRLGPGVAAGAGRTAGTCVALIREQGLRDGHLVKWLGGDEVDASLLAVAAVYDVLPLDDPMVLATVAEVERWLVDGGVHRYPSDTFYGGGQWPVLAALLAWHHARAGSLCPAEELLGWVEVCTDDDLNLPEQVPPQLAPDMLAEWLERWGPSARPLLWSHGMYLAALAQLATASGGPAGPDR